MMLRRAEKWAAISVSIRYSLRNRYGTDRPSWRMKGKKVFRENDLRDAEPSHCAEQEVADVSQIKVASFFAGIGGFDRAFELEKASVVFQCEKDKFCRSVLGRHWPKAEISEDIRSLDASDIPDANIWTAGFPCQDVSLARGNHGRNG